MAKKDNNNNNNNNNNNKFNDIKSLLDSIKQSLFDSLESVDCDLRQIDKTKVVNDIGGLVLDLANNKKVLCDILDCINKWRIEKMDNLQFAKIYVLANGIDYLQTAIQNLTDFCESQK